jgi:PAS domain S-box-containing protein
VDDNARETAMKKTPKKTVIATRRRKKAKPTAMPVAIESTPRKRGKKDGVRDGEQHFQLIADTAPVMIWITGTDKLCTWVSKPWLEFVGRTLDQELDNGWSENIHPDDFEACQRAYAAAFDARQTFSMEYRMRRQDGEYRWLLDSGAPRYDDHGAFTGYIGSCIDISDRKRVEDALRTSEQRFRLMADAAPVLIWTSGIDKLCTWFNKPWLDFTGRTLEQELGNGWTENLHAEDARRCLGGYGEAFDARKPFTMEYRLRRNDGEYRWMIDHGVPLYGAAGEFTGYIGSCIDITERKQAEEAAAAAHRHLDLAMSAGRIAAWSWNTLQGDASVRHSFGEFAGLSNIDSRAHGMALIHPEDRARHDEILDHSMKHGTPYQSVFRVLRPDNGQVIWLDVRAVPVTDAHGHVTAFSGVAIDITERKQAEESLRDREERLQAILDTATDAIITIDHGGIIRSVNAGAERMFGYTAAEMIGQSVKLLMPSPYREVHDGYLAKYLKTREKHIIGTNRETEAVRKDGTTFPVGLAVSEIENLKLFVGIHRDLSQRKKLEADVVEAAALEQRRIGQELHDDVGQQLTGMVMLVEALAQHLKEEESPHQALAEKIGAHLSQVRAQTRSISNGLVAREVDAAGFRAALEGLVARVNEQGKVVCTLEGPRVAAPRDARTATHLYRIVQEAIHNALRHGHAQHITVSMRLDSDNLTLAIRDDGAGIAESLEETKGLGIRLMHNRASLLGGQLTISDAKGGGTMVACTLPWRNYHE